VICDESGCGYAIDMDGAPVHLLRDVQALRLMDIGEHIGYFTSFGQVIEYY
jgi:hypothetical protein